MAVPKRKTSKARRDKRRSSVSKLSLPTLAKCQKCGAYNLRHRVCKKCGSYLGNEIVDMTKPEKTTEEDM
ncbi:MAG: 50S ribosomal protein L32 [Clostridia bacterium]|nr:50S ribosomal protein L32 [Clostridia bacterium]